MDRPTASRHRQVVIVDPSPDDASLIAGLIERPGITVVTVVVPPHGTAVDAPGLATVPVTRDLDEIAARGFDVAVVGSGCTRRSQIDRIVERIGARAAALDVFLATEIGAERLDALIPGTAGIAEAPKQEPAPASPPTPAPRPVVAITRDRAAPAPPIAPPHAAAPPPPPRLFVAPARQPSPVPPPVPTPAPAPAAATGDDGPPLGPVPSPDDPGALERALSEWVRALGAASAELHGGDAEQIQWVCRTGPADPLLADLVGLAFEHDAPRVVHAAEGFETGRFWAAWPFRTPLRRGVLAVSGVNGTAGHRPWERVVRVLAGTWDGADRERAGAAFPMAPGVETGWLSVPAVRHRLTLAVERNRRDGLPFGVHRITLSGTRECFDTMKEALPGKLRDTDCVCSPGANQLLLLVAGPSDAAVHLWKRIELQWEATWERHGGPPPAPALRVETARLDAATDADAFVAKASTWLLGG